jgi:hypothetical protein
MKPLHAFLIGSLLLWGWLAVQWLHNDGATSSIAAPSPRNRIESSVHGSQRPASYRRTATHRKPIQRGFLVRPEELFIASDQEAERQYRKRQSKDLVDLLRAHTAEFEMQNPGLPPEAIANQGLLYLKGWADGVVRTAPDLVDELADELEKSLCDNEASDAILITISRAIIAIPELANSKGFDCLFSRRTREDVVVWTALDAWKRSGLPKSAAITTLERTAIDSRTRQRFMSADEVSQQSDRAVLSASDSAPDSDWAYGPTEARVGQK